MGGKHTPIHLRPHAPVAERLLLTGDPGRALRLAQLLIEAPKMLNHNRGLWGYSGPAKADGALLTVQGTGLGGPSAAAVVADLAALGGRRAVRVGTCSPVAGRVSPGELIVAERVLAADGTSRALGAGAVLEPDRELTARLLDAAPAARAGALQTVDVHGIAGGVDGAAVDRDRTGTDLDGALGRDLASAAVLAAARRHAMAAAVIVVVAEPAMGDDDLHAGEAAAGSAAVGALALA